MSPLWPTVGILALLGTDVQAHLACDTSPDTLASHTILHTGSRTFSSSHQHSFLASDNRPSRGYCRRKRSLAVRFGENVDNPCHRPKLINLGEVTEADRHALLRGLLVDGDLLSPESATTDSAATLKRFDEGYNCQTLGRGFCNWVYKVDTAADVLSARSSASSQSSVVVKVFSELAKVRVEESILGSIDVIASDNGIGPVVLYRGHDGIVMQYAEGRVLTEEDVHGHIDAAVSSSPETTSSDGKDVCISVARKLAKLHGTELPPMLKVHDIDNMLWHTLDAMLRFVGSNEPIPQSVLNTGWTYDKLVKEVAAVKKMLEPLKLCKVLCHGDFKPSNIIVPTLKNSDIVLIDYELSGPGYRGFDFYKLFRTADKRGQNHKNMVAFVEAYLCEAVGGAGGTCTIPPNLIDDVMAEMKLFEPLTVSSWRSILVIVRV